MSSWHCSLDFFGDLRLAVYGAICQLEVCFNTWLWSQLNHVFVLHQFFFEIGVWDVMGKLWRSVIRSNACVHLAIEWHSIWLYICTVEIYIYIYIYQSYPLRQVWDTLPDWPPRVALLAFLHCLKRCLKLVRMVCGLRGGYSFLIFSSIFHLENMGTTM